jgi:hypothetical protein
LQAPTQSWPGPHDNAALEPLWSLKLLVNSPNHQVLTRAQVLDAITHGQLD